jgi:hypothetical protein
MGHCHAGSIKIPRTCRIFAIAGGNAEISDAQLVENVPFVNEGLCGA